jgi:predicted ATP-grasp superfamily ATP-dependent carboligase
MAAHGLVIDREVRLRHPALIAAFADWNDAGEAASAAVRWLVRRLPGRRFATIGAEHYHIFTSTRPVVHLKEGERRITWPRHDAFVHEDSEKPRDLVLFVGREPDVHWRAYCDTLLELATTSGATVLLTLGAFLGDTTHSRPVPLTGLGSTPELREQLDRIGAARAGYEGPGGITAALHDAARRSGLPAASLFAAVPQYLPTTANPKAALALVRGATALLGLEMDLSRLEAAAAFFQRQVDQAVAMDRRASGMLRAIERRTPGERQEPEGEGMVEPGDLPSAEDVVRDLEQFLRGKTDPEGDDGDAE